MQLSASEHGTAVKKKAAEKSRKVWAGFRPCSSTQLKATGKVPRRIAERICNAAMRVSNDAMPEVQAFILYFTQEPREISDGCWLDQPVQMTVALSSAMSTEPSNESHTKSKGCKMPQSALRLCSYEQGRHQATQYKELLGRLRDRPGRRLPGLPLR